jgi:TRAP-type mannitol/chloroaromatic compound transport system permease small subunit
VTFLLGACRVVDWINERIARFAACCVLLAGVISAGNAVSRYSFSLSSNAWLEIQWYLFGAIFMLGAAYTLKVNEHVRVDLIYGNLRPRARLWVDLAGHIVFLMPAICILAWMSWPLFAASFAINEWSGNAGGLPRWPAKLLIPVGFGLLALQGLSEIVKRIAMLTGHLEPATAYRKPLQ